MYDSRSNKSSFSWAGHSNAHKHICICIYIADTYVLDLFTFSCIHGCTFSGYLLSIATDNLKRQVQWLNSRLTDVQMNFFSKLLLELLKRMAVSLAVAGSLSDFSLWHLKKFNFMWKLWEWRVCSYRGVTLVFYKDFEVKDSRAKKLTIGGYNKCTPLTDFTLFRCKNKFYSLSYHFRVISLQKCSTRMYLRLKWFSFA